MGQTRPLFVYFLPFLINITNRYSTKVSKWENHGVLGIRARVRRIEGADKSTELKLNDKQINLFVLPLQASFGVSSSFLTSNNFFDSAISKFYSLLVYNLPKKSSTRYSASVHDLQYWSQKPHRNFLRRDPVKLA